MSNEIIQYQQVENETLSIAQLKERVVLVNKALNEIMIKDEHYGKIPGCGNKPTLLKAGTEKLCMLFRLSPSFEILVREMNEGHREYQVTTTLRHISTGDIWAQGVGCCSTMESKYIKQIPANIYNTVLKMAKKRSQADAVLTATGASDIFTQDIEDLVDNGVLKREMPKQAQPVKQSPPQTKTGLQPQHHKAIDAAINKMKESSPEDAKTIYETLSDVSF